MWKFAGLLFLSLLFPAVWGYLVHRLAIRIFPPARRSAAPWPAAGDTRGAAEFLDYQI